MNLRLEPDKTRFIDLSAPLAADGLIWGVDFSDERSSKMFLTLWFKGKTREQVDWCKNHPLGNLLDMDNHNPMIYHREPNPNYWPERYFERAMELGWNNHIHFFPDHHPTAADIEPFVERMSPALVDEIRAHFEQRKAA